MRRIGFCLSLLLSPAIAQAGLQGTFTSQTPDPANGMPCYPLTLNGWQQQANGIFVVQGEYNRQSFVLTLPTSSCSFLEGFIPQSNGKMLRMQVILDNTCAYPREFQVAQVQQANPDGPMDNYAVCPRLL